MLSSQLTEACHDECRYVSQQVKESPAVETAGLLVKALISSYVEVRLLTLIYLSIQK